ncbi:DNA/RNA polymerases superfamily protein [Gossypium australe]|uniref:DNA/RNA polymerases superfamily protein n=1 Tax=Gossypium australe TaxID=47621 RepID=A0A5B6WQT7_9ROSI|nr:DNA/RNA polymerases superfamily protein [Gossypium australe]
MRVNCSGTEDTVARPGATTLDNIPDQLPIVSELTDVFPKKLSGLSLDIEVEFVIDLVPGTAPIPISPYRMAPAELKELKVQL